MSKLLQINVDANNGSNGSIARELGKEALRRGWESYIAYGRRSVPSESTLIRIGSDFDVKMHGIQSRLFDNHGLASKSATLTFLKRLDNIKPNLVHLHNIHGYFLNYKILFEYLKGKNIPVVWTFHDCWPFTGHCGHFESIQCEKWKTGCHECELRKEYPTSWFFDRSSRNYMQKKKSFTSIEKLHITTVSKWLMSKVEDSFFQDYPITPVYNFVDELVFNPDVERIRRSDYRLDNRRILLGVAANWSPAKGVADFNRLADVLSDRYQVVMVGVTENDKSQISPSIRCIARVESPQKLAALYAEADILLNLSRQETFGMTTLEAMACGTPGISYNNTACPEVLSENTGVVVPTGDVEAVIAAIQTIEQNGKAYYRNNCVARANTVFSKNNIISQYFDVYEKVMSK